MYFWSIFPKNVFLVNFDQKKAVNVQELKRTSDTFCDF